MKVLVTGASGFVGCSLVGALRDKGHQVVSAVRHAQADAMGVGDIGPDTNWNSALQGVDAVIHCAARVHVMNDSTSDPLAEFRKVNVAGTLSLAKQAAIAGVKRFVFLSSVKVHGEVTQGGSQYTADDVSAPADAYGISKAEAESGLRLLARATGMELVIIRPPLVYGPGVKGNFSSLMSWVSRGLPLPLGAATANRRSLVGLDNLVDLILTCVDHPKAANQTLLVSDGEDLSTADLLRRIGKALNRPARLIPVPVSILIIASRLLGKSSIAQRLLGSLQVDISKTCTLLNWKPPLSVDEGLRRAAQQRL